jgi:hypothetical protein
LLVILKPIVFWVLRCGEKFGAKIDLEEGLDPYWKAVHPLRLNWTLKEEENARE